MYIRHEWVIFHKPYTVSLSPIVHIHFQRGERGEIEKVIEGENGKEYWIRLHLRNMTITLNEHIIDNYIEKIDYSKN